MCVRVWVWVLLCLRAHYMLHTDYFSFFFLKWGLRQESLVRMFLTHITHKRCRTELNCTIFMCPVLGALSYFWGSVDACSSTTHWAAVIFHSFFFWVHVTDVFATVSTSHHFILFPEYLLRTSLQLSRPLRCVLTPLASAPISSASCGACSQTTPCLQMPDVACASVRRCLCECQTLPVRMPDVACAVASFSVARSVEVKVAGWLCGCGIMQRMAPQKRFRGCASGLYTLLQTCTRVLLSPEMGQSSVFPIISFMRLFWGIVP